MTGAGDPIEAWSGHVIVCGLQGLGVRIVEQLHQAGVRVAVLDEKPDAALIGLVRAWGVPIVQAPSNTEEGLDQAGLAGAIAVICVQSDDLRSLEAALLIGQIRPDVRLVVQLANAAVGHAVQGVTGPGSVLDVAQLAAPSMVEACLGTHAVELVLGGVKFELVDVTVSEPDSAAAPMTLRALYGSLVPIAVVSADGSIVHVCPGRDLVVRPGETVRLLGTPEDLDTAKVRWRPQDSKASMAVGRRYAASTTTSETAQVSRWQVIRGVIHSTLMEIDRRLQFVVGGLIALTLISITVLHLGYVKPNGTHMTFLDATYFTVETVGTVGYGDFNFAEQQPWLRIFAICLMIAGGLSLATFFALLTNVLVSRRLAESLGRRRVTGMRDHVIVIGLGAVGLRVVQALVAAGRHVVVVERDEQNRYLAQARALGVSVFPIDATAHQALEAVNLAKASAIAILTSSDLTNIESALAVRDQLGPRWLDVPVVVRLFDTRLARTIERDFGFRHVRSTDALAAPWFVGAALGLQMLSTFYVEQQPFLVASLEVTAGSGLDGLAMRDLSARTRVVAIARNAGGLAGLDGATRLEHPPRRDTRFVAGDRAYMVGPYEELMQVIRRDALAPPSQGRRDSTASLDTVN